MPIALSCPRDVTTANIGLLENFALGLMEETSSNGFILSFPFSIIVLQCTGITNVDWGCSAHHGDQLSSRAGKSWKLSATTHDERAAGGKSSLLDLVSAKQQLKPQV
ncbi:hypothetical protein J6590_100031, partial [Homalodisca vitripennis]